MAMAFDGTSTWWGRNFISMAICFNLGGLRKGKMTALIEKVDKSVEDGAAGYVEVIIGWVKDSRAMQRRLGEPDKNLLSIYDFAVFMVDNCPENVGESGGVCALLEKQRRMAYDEMCESGVRAPELGEYVPSKIANCGLHVVNTFSANYNRRWKEVDEILVHQLKKKKEDARRAERVGADSQSPVEEGSNSYDQTMDDGAADGGGKGSERDAKEGLWCFLHSSKSKSDSKAMAYARWAYKALSCCVIYREALAESGATMEWRRTMTSRAAGKHRCTTFYFARH